MSAIKGTLSAIATLLLVAADSPALHAAEIARVATVNCDIHLTGRIELGDVDKLRRLLFVKGSSNDDAEEPWRNEGDPPKGRFYHGDQVQLCLQSDGGNFAEAIKIIKLILKYSVDAGFSGLMTVIEADKRCLSACALVFLAGRRHVGDGHMEKMRFMHPTAKLGFHGPYNESEAETKNPQLLARAQRAGVNAVADLLELDDDLFPRSLITSFLRIPGNDFFYASTVDHVGRWDIGLFDYRRPTIANMGQFMDLCDNTHNWKSARVVWRDPKDSETLHSDDQQVDEGRRILERTKAALAKGVTWMTLGEYGSEANERCSVQVFRGKYHDYVRASVHFVTDDPLSSFVFEVEHDDNSSPHDDPNKVSTPAWHFYRSDTKLMELQPATRTSRLFATFSDPRPDDSQGAFKLNGLQVKIAVSKGSWRVTFDDKTNKEARRVGLKLGTVLFQGTQVGDTVTGTAYAFSPSCAPTPLKISGKILNNRRFEFKGSFAKLPASCGAPIQNSGQLTFLFEPDRTMW
jgi:hypothetical protein